MRWIFYVGFLGAMWASPSFAQSRSEDLQSAIWASSCMACHGTDGRAEGTGLTLQGKSEQELYNALVDYKSGKRTGTIMHQHAKGYSDGELRRIARYFSQAK